jgi:putative phosphoribosyl transferase
MNRASSFTHTDAYFVDRADAGRRLAAMLLPYRVEQPLVLALPRGGVPVAYEIAHALAAPLDVLVVRKLGVPGQRELAMGAIATGDVCVLDTAIIQALGITPRQFDEVRAEESIELERRQRALRGNRPPLDVHDRTVILVDDGLATGSTARAALRALRQKQPRRLVLAVPVCAREPAQALDADADADAIVCALTPDNFFAVGAWYEHFGQTSDQEVLDLLQRADRERGGTP